MKQPSQQILAITFNCCVYTNWDTIAAKFGCMDFVIPIFELASTAITFTQIEVIDTTINPILPL